MKNILKIFKNDLKMISRNIIAFIVAIGISVLPALYSWFNIAANWDPYSNTGGIDFAVCSLDEGYTYKSLSINAGDEIISNLKQNDKMGWDFVSEKEALEGVENGKYYAAVIIPKNFSENLCSVTTGKFDQAELKYYVNEKRNAIAPKMTNAGVQTIQNQISSTYVSTITEVIATTLNLTADTLSDDKVTTANKIVEALDDLNDQIDTFSDSIDVFTSTMDSLETLVSNNKDLLPDVSDTLSKSGVITSDVKASIEATRKASKNTTDTVSDMIDLLGTTHDNISSQINSVFNNLSGNSSGELINIADSLNDSTTVEHLISFLTDLQNINIDTGEAVSTLQNLNSHQSELNNKVKAASETLKQTGSLPKETIDEIKALTESCESDIKTLKTSFEKVEKAISDMLDSAVSTQQSIEDQITAAFDGIAADSNGAADKLANITKLNEQVIAVDNQIIRLLTNMQTIFKIDNSAIIKTLEAINTRQQTIIDKINSAVNTIRTTGSLPKDAQDEIKELVKSCNDDFNAVVDSFATVKTSVSNMLNEALRTQSEIDSKLTTAADTLAGDTETAANDLLNLVNVNNKLVSVNDTIITFLNNTQESFGIDNSAAINKLNSINSYTGQLSEKLKNAADVIEKTGELPNDLKSEINNLTKTLKNEISSLKTSFKPVKNSINNAVDDVYDVLENASGLLQAINGDIPDLEKTLDNTVGSLQQIKKTFNDIKKLVNDYKGKIKNLQEKVKELRDNDTMENLVSTIIERPEALGNFVANPVTLETTEVHPVENYGSAMTPFYSTLGFWVGSVVLVAVIKTDLTKRELKRLDKPTTTQLFFGRFLTFFVFSQIQALIIALGDVFFLQTQCKNIPLFIVSAMISSAVYVLITYSLTITFSVIGKALSVIILVIQVAGSGGTFPIEVLPSAFQSFAPYLPFKYSINMMREAVCGVDARSYMINLLCLLAFVPFALLLGLLLRRPCIKLMTFFNERLEESGLIV